MYREKVILRHIEGKDVLDIGSVGQTNSYSLWEEYQKVPYRSLTGIDIEGITKENEQLFQVKKDDVRIIKGNMEDHIFDMKFDVVVAGDVIEHVNNQGLFLSNIHNCLKSDGHLIITTPNAKWPTVFLKPNPTHCIWHDRYTLRRALEMNGFIIEDLTFYFGNKKNYNIILRPLVARQAILVIAKKKVTQLSI
jgi:2-polyprenyl-3-methyl-5-hydroxy-6-metoxy-1,4-benzoquinol methylase